MSMQNLHRRAETGSSASTCNV